MPTFRALLSTLIACAGSSVAAPSVSFNNDIRPLLSNGCFRCHGPDENTQEAGLRLDTFAGATADNNGVRAIVPGDPDASELLYRLTSHDADEVMPPPEAGERFAEEDVALIRRWIEEGAEYERHWSYTRIERPAVPEVAGASENPVDAFLLQRLRSEGLEFAPEADRATLARRAALDLTGLPPTPGEVAGFVADPHPDAFGRYVDAQLAKPGFGEHWARMWLDLARYADSAGYADDPARTIWGYRDWVIRAFNANMPFDQFTIEQIAGDLLDTPTIDQLVATGFHRNTQTNNEGGTDDEEFRNVAVVDRVNTTMATWMGTTMTCAHCHTHKYDPISQRDYFEMFAILNQTEDRDRRDEAPTVGVFSADQVAERAALEAELATLRGALAEPTAERQAAMRAWAAGLADEEARWSPVAVTRIEADSGATFTDLGDSSWLVGGEGAETDIYVIEAEVGEAPITALRIEALPHASLSHWGGPGRNGNFVLNEIALDSGLRSDARRARYLRIEHGGGGKFLHLAEVQAFDTRGENVAANGEASQSSDYRGAAAARAIDGNTEGDYNQGSVSHTGEGDPAPWWEVDLGAEIDLSRIVVWNRTDGEVRQRLRGARLRLLDAERGEVWSGMVEEAPERERTFTLDGAQSATFAGASSTFDQAGFEVGKAVDGDARGNSGWAVGGQLGRAHSAVFELQRPLPGGPLRLTLKQSYAEHALGRFRISVATDPAPHRALPHGVAAALAVPEGERDEAGRTVIWNHFVSIDPFTERVRQQIAAAEQGLNSLEPATTVPVMRELAPDRQRETFIHLRGNFRAPGDKVQPGLPGAFFEWETVGDEQPDRMDLAKWLVHRDNPLTARVTANRYWEKLFGIGIVPTSEEFGSQGEPPTHPELLDWLAAEFIEGGWDTKAMLKLLVTSRAYRQDSRVSPELAERDPDNRLLARGPRFRLSAEMVRDQALAVGGLLSDKMYGAPVRPPQPDLGIKAAFGGGIDWKTSAGEDRYRRGIYTTWRRSNPYPSMAAFDAPNREVCTLKRDRTNTPLQALVTLNDPVYVEAAQSLARRMAEAARAGQSAAAGIDRGFELCLLREATPGESGRLLGLFREALGQYREQPELAAKMATDPLGPLPEGMDAPELAALTLVANVLLNLDEFLMKR